MDRIKSIEERAGLRPARKRKNAFDRWFNRNVVNDEFEITPAENQITDRAFRLPLTDKPLTSLEDLIVSAEAGSYNPRRRNPYPPVLELPRPIETDGQFAFEFMRTYRRLLIEKL